MTALLHQLLRHINQRRIRPLQVGGKQSQNAGILGPTEELVEALKKALVVDGKVGYQVLTAFHSRSSTAQEDRFGRCIENTNLVTFEQRNRQERNIAQPLNSFCTNPQMPNKSAVRFVLGGMQPEQLQRYLLEQHIVVFVHRENAFSYAGRGCVHVPIAGRKIA